MTSLDDTGRVHTLITASLRTTNRSRNDLADQLGISRTTLWRKLATLDANTLRAAARETALDYPALLRAALQDAGLITSNNELLDGLTLTTVTQVVSDTGANAETTAVFTDPHAAEAYADLANDVARGDAHAEYQTSTIRVDTSADIPYITAYTARWKSHTDTITVESRRYAELPRSLRNADGISDFHASTATPSDNGIVNNSIVELAVTATTEHAARTALAAKLDDLRIDGALAALNQPLPWRERGAPTPSASVTQTVPNTFAAAINCDTPTLNEEQSSVDYFLRRYGGPPFSTTLTRHSGHTPQASSHR